MVEKTLIPLSHPALGEREIGYLEDCVYSGRISTEGGFVEGLESRFAKWLGVQHAVATANGTAALHLTLAALGLRRGDEVIVPTLGYVSLANAVSYTGARPVLVDVSPESWTIDPEKARDKIGPKTKGIIASHLYGYPADLDRLNRMAARHELFLIESASDALGTTYKGERAGTLSTAACFSFSQGRTLTTGGGGMMVTDNEELAVRARFLSGQGRVSRREYLHSWIGFNYRMTNLHAALGVAQMDEIDLRISVCRDIGRRYEDLLSEIPGLSVGPAANWGSPSFGRIALIVEKPFPVGKGDLQRRLRREGIESEPFYYPIHMQIPYMKSRRRRLREAEKLYEHGLLLPTSTLMGNEDLLRVAGAIRRVQAEGAPRKSGSRRPARKDAK